MICAIAGVISFQFYWVVNTYQITEKRFEKDIGDAITDAIETNLISMIGDDLGEELLGDSTLKFSFDSELDFSDFLKDSSSFISVTADQSGLARKDEYIKSDTLTIGIGEDKEILNKEFIGIIANILNMAFDPEYEVDFLDSLLTIKLNEKGIFTSFNISILSEAYTSKGSNTVDENNNFIITRPFSSLNKDEKVLQVVFPSRVSLIIKKMWLSLLGSFVLIMSVVSCLLLMLSIIYKQKRLSDMKGDFINNMTHEFKTPIATVSAAIEALTNFEALEDKVKTDKYLSLSKNELQRLNLMVEKVLRIAEYEREEVSINKDDLELKKMVDHISNRYLVHKYKAIEIVNGIPESATLFADNFHIKTILSNLIDNSVKYSLNNVKIEIDFIESEQKSTLIIKDDGIGIAKDQLKYIFDKFYRITDGNLYKVKGFGLGLSYVKHLVDEHQGRIQVLSTLNEGTLFKIDFPKQ